nr:SurA N-terminal domain-containing protein [Pseudodesulfovibrio senegalensis]
MRNVFLIFCVLLVSSLPAMADEYVANRIIVSVNDQIITEYDLNERMQIVMSRYKQAGQEPGRGELEAIRKKLLDSMIQEMLFAQEVEKYGITVDEDAVQAEVDRLKERSNLDDAAFKEQLAREGLDMNALQEQIRSNMKKQRLLGGMVSRKVLVTDSETREAYEARKQEYFTGGGVHLAIIMVPDNVSADEVMRKINDGELSFEEAVLQYSDGPGVESGGDIGEMSWSSLDDDWRAALRGMEVDDIKGPVEINGAPVIIRLLGNSKGTYVPFEEVKDSIYTELLKEKREKVYDEYLKGLKEKAVIRYMD